MNNPNPLAYTSLRKALINCIDALEPCILILKSIDDAKLYKQINQVVDCSRNCKKTLTLIDSKVKEMLGYLPACEVSCKKCLTVCNGIDLDSFKKATTAIKDCIGSIQYFHIKQFKKGQ